MPRFSLIAACGLLLVNAAVATAYNKATHMVSGAIAYHVLKADSPQTLEKIVGLLKQHPEYGKFKLDTVAADDRDMFLFMLAARWSDDIRGNRTYDHPTWHYINFPFKPEGQPDSVNTAPPADENILTALDGQLATLRGNGPASDKAVALCWLFHLIGDIHQPLHTTSLFTTQFPNGDRGGTRFYIRVRETTAPISLHKFWDDLILGSDRFQTVRNRATELRLRPEFAPNNLIELGLDGHENWAKESLQIAEKVAYQEGKLNGSLEKTAATALPDGYVATAKAVAERRIVLAGYRIAAMLKTAR